MPQPDEPVPGATDDGDCRTDEPRAATARGTDAPAPADAPAASGPPLTGRASSSGRERRELVSLMTSRVRDVFLRKPFFVDGGTDLVSLCRELSRQGLSEALVRDGGRIGIFTTTDLRDALLRDTAPGTLAVREVATFEPWSIGLDDELHEALVLMLRHRIHRLLVRGEGSDVVGILGQLDLMAFVANQSHLIALEAAHAGSLDELKSAARQIDSLVAVLHADGVKVEVIAALVGEINRQIFARLWELIAPEDLRANSCLVVMGSEGRGEQIIKTDQDNALLLRDGFACAELEAVTGRFTAALIDFGYPPCPGGIMLSRPLWRQPLAAFKDTLRRWIIGGPDGPDKDGHMNLAIFLDAAPVAGDASLLRAARAHVDFLMMNDQGYFARFAQAVERFGEGGSWWSRLPGLTGRAAAEIDIKKLGIFPLVHGVRALALEHRIAALGTADRLKALVSAGHLDAGFARDLTDALRLLIGVKLSSNLRQIADGRPPGNAIRLTELGTLDRQALKEALAIVRGFKQWLSRHYRFDAL